MRSSRWWWGSVGGLFVLAMVAGACGMDDHRPAFHEEQNGTNEFADAKLGDGFDDDSVADFLQPEEREAVKRSGMTGLGLDEDEEIAELEREMAEPARPKGGVRGALDTAGRASVAVLGVGLTLGAIVAPFFLF